MKKTMEAPSFGDNVARIMATPVYTTEEAALMLWGRAGVGYHSGVPISRTLIENGVEEVIAVRGDTVGSVTLGTRRHVVGADGAAHNEYDIPNTKYL